MPKLEHKQVVPPENVTPERELSTVEEEEVKLTPRRSTRLVEKGGKLSQKILTLLVTPRKDANRPSTPKSASQEPPSTRKSPRQDRRRSVSKSESQIVFTQEQVTPLPAISKEEELVASSARRSTRLAARKGRIFTIRLMKT